MFRSASWIGSLLIFSISILWISYLCIFRQTSSLKKEKLHIPHSLSEPQLTTAKQSRTQVRKDIWISELNQERLHNRIESEKSLLILQPHGKSLEVIEELYGIRCWSQEKIYTADKITLQQMRFLEAKEGSYKYQTQTFQALKANLSLYKMPGISLPIDLRLHRPFLKGTAEEISFAIQSGVPFFQAHEFHASLNQGGSL